MDIVVKALGRVRRLSLQLWAKLKGEKLLKLLQIIQVLVWFFLLVLGGQSAGGISYISENVAVLREQVKSLESERDTWQEAFEKTLSLLRDVQRRNVLLQSRLEYITHCIEAWGKARPFWEDVRCSDIIENSWPKGERRDE